MARTRNHKWHYEETGVPFGESSDQREWHEEPDCPKCGKRTHYWEGTIDQDRMGNDIHGENYVCYECQIGTECEEKLR